MRSTVKFFVFLVAVFMAVGFGQTARADLVAVGAVDPATLFPLSFTDRNGQVIGPCDVVNEDPATPAINGPPCGALALLDWGDPAVPGDGPGFVAGNIEEVTFYRAENVAGANSRLRIEVQGGVLPPESVINGVLLRLNAADLAVDGVGDYTVVTPLGTFTVTVVAADLVGGLNTTLVPDGLGIGATIPPFDGARLGGVQFFVPNGTGGAGFLGDSLTAAPLTPGFGWPLVGPEAAAMGAVGDGENVFRVTGPLGTQIINSPGFTVEGKILAGSMTVNPPGPVALGNVNTGSVKITNVTVSTQSPTPITITAAPTGVTLTGSADFSIGTDTCSGAILASGQSCVVTVRYLPVAVAPANTTLTILSDSPITPTFNVAFSGTGSGAQVFPDVAAANFFENHINSIFNSGITTGFPDGTFGGELNVSRDQMAAFLVRAEDGVEPTACNAGLFGDVTAANFFCAHITRLNALGITTGFQDGTFRPGDLVSREQMAAFIVRAVDNGVEPTVCNATLFTDVTAANFFCPHITRLQGLGVTTGFQDGTYRPGGFVTRQEMAAFLARAFLGLP